MVYSSNSLAVHDDTIHQTSAKRGTTSGVKGIDAALALSPKLVLADIDAAVYNVASGIAGLDANARIQASKMPTKLTNSYWHASYDENSVVQGSWSVNAAGLQEDYDPALINAAGYITNMTSPANGDEIDFGMLYLTAGTYKVSFATRKNTSYCIMEILLGSVSLGTFDEYNAASLYNQVGTFTYSPSVAVSGNLRVKVSGKNGSSSDYILILSRLEIIRTG